MCTDSNGYLEDVIRAVAEFRNNYKCIILYLMIVLSIAVTNFSGVLLTKNVNAVFRTFWNSMRNITVWIFGVIIG